MSAAFAFLGLLVMLAHLLFAHLSDAERKRLARRAFSYIWS